LLSVPAADRLSILGLPPSRWQAWRSIAGMVAVITAALAGSAAGLLTAVISNHSLAAALVAGTAVAIVIIWALMRRQTTVWTQASTAQLFSVDAETPNASRDRGQ
jgi:hypothetical protein